jgi:hypothetical protein
MRMRHPISINLRLPGLLLVMSRPPDAVRLPAALRRGGR